MKFFVKIFLSFSLFCLVGCATHGTFVTEQKDAWIDGYSVKNNYADKGLHYCKANAKEDGLANPVCYRAKFVRYEDEKPHFDSEKQLKSK